MEDHKIKRFFQPFFKWKYVYAPKYNLRNKIQPLKTVLSISYVKSFILIYFYSNILYYIIIIIQ